jgi:predicted deacylase
MKLACRILEGKRSGPHLLITAGVHGDEFEGMAAVRRLAREIDPAELRGKLTLVPVVNEAAYQNGQRTADDGLDLARTCPGRSQGSVTERIAWALSNLIRESDCYIDLHSGGTTMSVWPLAGYVLHQDPKVLDTQREMARAFNLPVIWGTDPTLPGRSLSVARDAGVPAIYAEYLGSGSCSHEGVRAYVEGCRNVMVHLGMLEGESPPTRLRHEIEDAGKGSGHMQVCNPSPRTGFFEPAVALGQRVKSGDLFGTVCDVLGDEVDEVRADRHGVVLVLRTYCRVMEGDSLGVILQCIP